MHLTIEWGNPTVMQVIQEFDTDYNNFTTTLRNPCGRPYRKVLDSGPSINYRYGGVSLLQLAAEVNNAAAVRFFAPTRRICQQSRDSWMDSSAFSSVPGDTESVCSILQRNADKNVRDEYGWTPLDLAAFIGMRTSSRYWIPSLRPRFLPGCELARKYPLAGVYRHLVSQS